MALARAVPRVEEHTSGSPDTNGVAGQGLTGRDGLRDKGQWRQGAATEAPDIQASVSGFSGDFLRQATSGVATLLLSNLPAHDTIDLNFLLAIIDSWDGTDPTFGPDFFNVRADGNLIFSDEFAFFGDPSVYSAPPGGKLTPGPPYSHLGFNGGYPDQAYDMGLEPGLSFPHTSSMLFLEAFASGAGFQGGLDESWAIENFQVVVNTVAVPEPTSLLLFGTGGLGLLAAMRRRKKQNSENV